GWITKSLVAVPLARSGLDDHRVAELSESFVFDLADALAGETDLLADFLEGHRVAAAQAVTKAQDFRLALVDAAEQAAELLQLVVALHGHVRTQRVHVCD